MRRIVSTFCLAASLLGVVSQTASAATVVWTNLNGGLWSNTNNWSPNQIPDAADTAVITNAGTYTITNNATVTLTTLALGDTNSPGTPTLFNSGTFTVTNTTVAANGLIYLSTGTFTTAGPADIAGTFGQANGTWQLNAPATINNYNLTNGELRGANCIITNLNWVGGGFNSDSFGTVTTIPVGGTLNISGVTAKGLSYWVPPGRVLNNNGTATWSGAGISAQCGATINNAGSMTLIGDFSFAWGGTGLAPVFNNTGTLTKSSGSGNFTISQGYFNNSNSVTLNSGSLNVNGQFNSSGTVNIANGSLVVATTTPGSTNTGTIILGANSFLDLNSGVFRLDGAVNSPTTDHIRFQGATVTVVTTNITAPSIFQNGGTVFQNTNVVVAAYNQALGTLFPTVPVALNTYNLTNGDMRGADCVITNFNWLGGGVNADGPGSNTTTIPVGGTLTISGATAKGLSYYVAPGRKLVNNGTAAWSGAGISGQDSALINNAGTMTLNGDFSFAWAGLGGGVIFNNTGTLTKASGSGNFAISQGYFNNSSIANFNTGSLNINGQFNNSGNISIANGSLVVATTTAGSTNSGGIALGANSFLDLNSGVFRLDGAVSSPTTDRIRFQGATVTVVTTNITAPSIYQNGGTVFQNTNVVVAAYNQALGTLFPTVPIALNIYNLTNGDIRGADCVITNFNWLGGGVNADGPGSNTTTIPVGGTLTISGATAKGLSYYVAPGRRLNNNGTATWTGAGISCQDGATINNAGTMTLNGDFSFAWAGLGSGPIINNTGTFTKASGSGNFTLTSAVFNNFNTLNLNSGSLNVSGQFNNFGVATVANGSLVVATTSGTSTNAGSIALGANSFLDLNSGAFRLDGAVSSPTTDHIRFQGATVTVLTTNITAPSILQTAGTVFQGTNVVVAVYDQAAGTLYASVPVSFGTYNMTNAELRGANVVITNFNWFGGALNSENSLSNTVTIPNGGTLNISSATGKSLSDYAAAATGGRRLINNGTANWSGANITGYYGPAIINNNLLNITSDLGFYWSGNGNNPLFLNNATINLTSGTDFILSTCNFTNNGAFNMVAGSLTMNGPSGGTVAVNTSSGLFNLDASSFLYCNLGTFNLGGSVISPAANHIQCNGMTVNVNTTNLSTPTFYVTSGTVFQNINVVVDTYNIAAGALWPTLPVVFNTVNLTNAELRGANSVITNFNWFGGSLNSENSLSNTVTIPVGGTLNISGATAKALSDYSSTTGRRIVNNGTMNWSGANITGYWGPAIINNNLLNITSDLGFYWSGNGSGPLFLNNATVNLTSGTDFILSTCNFTNSGTFNITAGSLTMNGPSGGTVAVNTGAGLFNLDASSFLYCNVGTLNLGGSVISPTANHVQFNGMTVSINTTNLNTPTLYETAGTVFQNTNVVVDTYNIAAGALWPMLPVVFNTVNLTNAELRGANSVITNFNWFGGSLNSENSLSNTVTIPAGGTLNISSATAKALGDYSAAATGGRRLINNGTANWSGANITGYWGPSFINNNLLNITSDLGFYWSGNGSGPLFVNNATLNLTSGTDFILSTCNFTNNGNFNITAGSLTMNGPSGGTVAVNTSSGLFNLDASSFLYCNLGTFNLGGSVVSPTANHIQFNGMTVNVNTINLTTPSLYQTGGTVNQNTNVVVNTYNQAAGTLFAALPLSFNNYNLTNAELRGANVLITNFNWLGGSLNSENAASNTITIPAGGSLNISSATAKALGDYSSSGNGRRLVHNGTGSWGGTITAYWDAKFSNSGSLTMTNDAGLIWGGGGSGATFINSGTFTKTAGTGVSPFTTTTITNSGTFNINSGGISIGGPFIQTAGSANLGTNLTAGSNVRIDAGAFNGRGSIAGTFYNNGSSSAGAPLGLLSAASFTNTSPSTWNVELGGTSAGTNYDQLKLTGSATLNGALNVSFANGFTPTSGNIFTVLTFTARSGVFSSDNVASKGLSIQYSGTNVLLLADNLLPTVSVTAPGDNFNSNCICEPVLLQANALDTDGSISNVTFFVDSNLVSVASNAPYLAMWSTDAPGLHTVTALARDNRGGETTTNVIVRFYGRGGTNVLNPYLLSTDITTNNLFIPKKSIKLCLEGEPGRDYDIEAATDLIVSNWSVIGQITLSNNQWIFFDTNATNFNPDRFYRAVRLPRTP